MRFDNIVFSRIGGIVSIGCTCDIDVEELVVGIWGWVALRWCLDVYWI